MSQQPETEMTAPVSEEIIREQIDTCKYMLGEIIEGRMDVEAEEDIYRDIDGFLGNVEEATLDCFIDRKNTSTLFDQLKWLLRALIKERGYEEKLVYDDGEISDNPVEICRWFKLYATVGLNTEVEIQNIIAIEQFGKYREDNISHPTELPSPQGGTDPVLLSSLLLMWYAIEEIIDLWGQLLDEEELDTHLQLLDESNDVHIGFVSRTLGDHGYITSYQNGESGKSIRMEPQHVAFFPSEGDIVRLEAEQQYNHRGDSYPALTPVIDNSRIQPFP